ncbi:unnamed protein product, partial [Mesorhabditis spiculigera]
MVVARGALLEKGDDSTVLCVSYHLRKLAVALSTKNGFQVVIYKFERGRGIPKYRKDIDRKIVHIQWKSNGAVFVITEGFFLHEFSISGTYNKVTTLDMSQLKEREWEITAAEIQKIEESKEDCRLYVALAVKCSKDIVKSAIKSGTDLYKKNKKKKKNPEQDGDDNDDNTDDEFDERVALAFFQLNKEYNVLSQGFFEDCHAEPVNTMCFESEGVLLTGGEDGIVNVLALSEVDEDEALQTTIPIESSVRRVVKLDNNLIGVVTDDNKQVVFRMDSPQDYEILHRRQAMRDHFLIDIVRGPPNTPVAAIEYGPNSETTIIGYNEMGKDSAVLIRTYDHTEMIRTATFQGNVACLVDDDNNFSAFNVTRDDQNADNDEDVALKKPDPAQMDQDSHTMVPPVQQKKFSHERFQSANARKHARREHKGKLRNPRAPISAPSDDNSEPIEQPVLAKRSYPRPEPRENNGQRQERSFSAKRPYSKPENKYNNSQAQRSFPAKRPYAKPDHSYDNGQQSERPAKRSYSSDGPKAGRGLGGSTRKFGRGANAMPLGSSGPSTLGGGRYKPF